MWTFRTRTVSVYSDCYFSQFQGWFGIIDKIHWQVYKKSVNISVKSLNAGICLINDLCIIR